MEWRPVKRASTSTSRDGTTFLNPRYDGTLEPLQNTEAAATWSCTQVSTDTPQRRVMEFDFRLTYQLPDNQSDAAQVIAKLGAEGCIDALVGLGVAGQVSLEFVREVSTAEAAIMSAYEDVMRALPNATLIEAAPHFVG